MNIFASLPQGDSATWTDEPVTDSQGNLYTSAGFTLTYRLAGPLPAPVVIVATASGTGWTTTLTTAVSSTLTPGLYWWSAVLTASGVQVTAGGGELTIVDSLANFSGGPYDGRSYAEKALATAQAALANLGASGGVASYTIAGRTMMFSRATLLQEISYWQSIVLREQTAKRIAQGLGNPRTLAARFVS